MLALNFAVVALDPTPKCPSVSTVSNFDLSEFVRATWYIQKQQPNSYQPVNNLNCVSATYNLQGASVRFYRGPVVSVYNVATESDLTTEVGAIGDDPFTLYATGRATFYSSCM